MNAEKSDNEDCTTHVGDTLLRSQSTHANYWRSYRNVSGDVGIGGDVGIDGDVDIRARHAFA